ncbi:pyridoxamine 5'-phosphate oxidase family protein [Frankia sp. AgB1.9]|nr:pyridoxamine 5'-phosphate oxidase family protein [Frankia sp. AgW1.1]MBL7553652.1 pyridoxamine 5'-phosphate oxidase family protein [Frankia sp. AgB1.9]MBL7617666.1 pyridoxamine 5'-phosphate oxidase family protein [Frankia sp. AgB1.8]
MANEQALDFVWRHPDAAMITLRPDGTAHMARIEVAAFDGKVWATGTGPLVRTKNLRRDPRCSLFVFGAHPHWLGLETTATITEGRPRHHLDGASSSGVRQTASMLFPSGSRTKAP